MLLSFMLGFKMTIISIRQLTLTYLQLQDSPLRGYKHYMTTMKIIYFLVTGKFCELLNTQLEIFELMCRCTEATKTKQQVIG
jgi:hypothetical protein